MEKSCNCCNKLKNLSEFAKMSRNKDGLDSNCKECRNSKNKKYRDENKKSVKIARKKYYDANIDKLRESKRNNSLKFKSEKVKYDKEYRKNNKEKIKTHKQNWEIKNKDNINLRLKRNLRRRLNHFVKGTNKSDHTLLLLGCDFKQFKKYIESLFLEGMSWDNYGMNGWHLDHIKPCISFDFSDFEQQKQCFHYTNLQPLWWIDNLKKSKKYEN